MIQLKTQPVKEDLEVLAINRDDVKFINFLPTCPKCKLTNDVFYFNVTKKVFECTGCNLRFHFA